MDLEDYTLEEKCENLMNVVVESRKRFGKMCVEYEEKTSIMDNKILNLQLQTIASCNFKTKLANSEINVDDMCSDIDRFIAEVSERQKKIDDLKKKIKNTQDVVLQLKKDNVGRKLKEPLTTEALLANAKNKA